MSILIRYLHKLPQEPGAPEAALGEITLGTFVEEFEMILTTWDYEQYEQQWRTGIQRLLKGELKSCFLTSYWREKDAFGGEWWPMYRVQDQVIVQNHLIRPDIFEQHFENFDPEDPYLSIPDRRSLDENGRQISEWSIPFDQIAALPH
jgi:hypothetical protein